MLPFGHVFGSNYIYSIRIVSLPVMIFYAIESLLNGIGEIKFDFLQECYPTTFFLFDSCSIR